MASAESLKGRRIPSFPGHKSNETVTFIGSDGNPLEVVKSISKQGLALLKKQGYVKESEYLRKQEQAALAKGDPDNEEEPEDEVPDDSWNRKDIDAWASELDPPLDTTNAGTKADALKLIQERLDEDESEDDSDDS